MGVLMGKSSINGPFSMAMLDNQRIIHPFINGTVPLNIRFFCQSPVWKSVVSPPNISKFWPYRCSFFYISSQCQILTAGQKKTSEERGKINARDIVHVSYQASWPRKMTRIWSGVLRCCSISWGIVWYGIHVIIWDIYVTICSIYIYNKKDL